MRTRPLVVGALMTLAAGAAAPHGLPPAFGPADQARTAPDPRVRTYLTATRVVWTSDASGTHVKNANRLLLPGTGQAELVNRSPAVLRSDANHTAGVLL